MTFWPVKNCWTVSRLKLVYEMWLLSEISQAAFVATVGIYFFARRPELFVWTGLHVALNRKLMVLTKEISVRAHRGITNHLWIRKWTCLFIIKKKPNTLPHNKQTNYFVIEIISSKLFHTLYYLSYAFVLSYMLDRNWKWIKSFSKVVKNT